VVTRRPGKPHPMQGQAGPFAGCPPRSRSAAKMDGCSRQNPAYRLATEGPRHAGAFYVSGQERAVPAGARPDPRRARSRRAARAVPDGAASCWMAMGGAERRRVVLGGGGRCRAAPRGAGRRWAEVPSGAAWCWAAVGGAERRRVVLGGGGRCRSARGRRECCRAAPGGGGLYPAALGRAERRRCIAGGGGLCPAALGRVERRPARRRWRSVVPAPPVVAGGAVPRRPVRAAASGTTTRTARSRSEDFPPVAPLPVAYAGDPAGTTFWFKRNRFVGS
jgi:hypothetical protein